MRYLDNWLKSYLDFCRHTEAHPKFHFWTGVSVIASALRRCVKFPMGEFAWHPNFFVLFVAPPAVVTKTYTLDRGIALLKDAALNPAYERGPNFIPGVFFGPSSITWQKLIERMSEANCTIEAPGTPSGLSRTSPMTLAIGELGTLMQGDTMGATIDQLNDLWDCRPDYERDTKGDGSIKIFGPCLNMIAATTPSWIQENFGSYLVDGGLASRLVLVAAEQKYQPVAYPARKARTLNLEDLRYKLVMDLIDILSMSGEYTMAEEAYDYGEEWYNNFWAASSGVTTEMRSYAGRKFAYIHKLAMVLSAAQSSDRHITLDHLRMAIEIMDIQEQDYPKVLAEAGSSQNGVLLYNVLQYLKQRVASVGAVQVSKGDIYRTFARKANSLYQLDEVINGLIIQGYLLPPLVDTPMSQAYKPSPILLKLAGDLKKSATSKTVEGVLGWK